MHTFLDPLGARYKLPNSPLSYARTLNTYAQFGERCQRLAAFLQSKGAKFGDRVAIWAANSHRYMEAYVGIPAAGMVVVPLNTRMSANQIRAGRWRGNHLLADRDPGGLADVVDTVIMMSDEYEQPGSI